MVQKYHSDEFSRVDFVSVVSAMGSALRGSKLRLLRVA